MGGLFFTLVWWLRAVYEARKFGVRSAMPIKKARKLCPDGIYLLPRMERYHEISDQIHEVLHRFSPYLEPIFVR